jgi:predicted RNase H-like HicB family nuclease
MTSAYRVEVQALSEEDGGGFIAFAPDLPGCISDGETQEDAIRNLRDAITQWIDEAHAMGREVPEPTVYRSHAAA